MVADRRILPAAQALLIEREGRATPPFYDYMRRVVNELGDLSRRLSELQELIDQIGDLSNYTRRDVNELISAQWSFRNDLNVSIAGNQQWHVNTERVLQNVPLIVNAYDGILVDNPDYPNAGIALTTITGVDPLNNGIGNQLAFWEVGDGGAFTPRSYGFRIRHTGELDQEGNLDFYRHQNSVNGVLFMRFTRDSSQIQFTTGTPGAPVLTSIGDLDTGISFPSPDTVTVSTGGTARATLSSTQILTTVPLRGPNGSASAPSVSFSSSTGDGIYLTAAGNLGFALDGVQRLRIENDQIVGSLPYVGPDGTALSPGFGFESDQGNGLFLAETGVVAIATGGIERLRVSEVGALGIAGANYGALGQVLTSNGASSAPSWQDASGGGNTVFDLYSFVPGTPIADQLLFKFVAVRPLTFGPNFAGAAGAVRVPPTASFVMNVLVAGALVGTITVGTTGTYTFATLGGSEVALAIGEALDIEAPSSPDATIEDIAITLPAEIGEPPAGASFSYPITISAGTVSANLTNFPVYFPLNNLPPEFWAAVKADGGDIRVLNSLGAEVPIDLVRFDSVGNTGVLFFRAASILAASDNEWTLTAGEASKDLIPATDPLGRNAVWADYEVVYLFADTGSGDLVDRTGNHNLSINTGTPSYSQIPLGAGGGLTIASDLRLVTADAIAAGTTFTLAASGTFSNIAAANRTMAAYLQTLGSNTGRCNLGARQATTSYTNWDNTNSWNDGSLVTLDSNVRLHGVWNGATNKQLYLNGVLNVTDATVTAIGTGNDLFVVGEGGAGTSFHRGNVGFVYLRLTTTAAAWAAAEYLNLSNPAAFFTAGVESMFVGAVT